MSDHSTAFVAHLERIAGNDRGTLAALRRSLGFSPGAYPPAFPSVERFAGGQAHMDDARRRALYIVAGLFALHPHHGAALPPGAAFGTLMQRRGSESIEGRFIALLSADPEHVHEYLRQLVSLLSADGIAIDYAQLLDDLSRYLPPFADERRDAVRQRWARDFYRITAAVDRADRDDSTTDSES